MPTFGNAFALVSALEPGRPGYVFGSFNELVPNTAALVTSVATASNVATVGLKLTAGNIPAVGSLISIQGTTQATGAYNVNRVAITGVSGFDSGDNSTGTVTFALSSSNLSTAAASGQAIVATPELSESLANGASVALAAQQEAAFPNQGKTVTLDVSFPSLPTACTVNLQGAVVNSDADYQTIANSTITVATSAADKKSVTIPDLNYRFYRALVAGVTGGTSPTIVAKLLI
jgi:hypothetical protein